MCVEYLEIQPSLAGAPQPFRGAEQLVPPAMHIFEQPVGFGGDRREHHPEQIPPQADPVVPAQQFAECGQPVALGPPGIECLLPGAAVPFELLQPLAHFPERAPLGV